MMSGPKNLNKLFEKLRDYSFPCIAAVSLLIIIDVPAYFRYAMYTEQYLGIYLAMLLAGTFLHVPYKKGADFTAIDLVLAVLSLAAGLYVTFHYPKIAVQMGRLSTDRTVFGILSILLILEALRRSMGFALPIICLSFLLYVKFGSNLNGVLAARPFTLARMVNYIFLDPNSLMYMLTFGATVGVAFIFFGQVLLHYGGGKAFIDFALLFCGRSQGGSAKTAIVASGLVGTITGAPMSNVLLTGSVTIPMMKSAGYPPHMAGAVEAVASSGGQIMPPVMGIAAFIIAETLGVPYAKVALAALIPAILFYFATFVQVHMDAAKFNLKRIPPEQLPKPGAAIRDGWFIVPPIAILLICMFVIMLPAAMSAIIAGAAGVPCMLIKPENRKGFWRKLIGAFRECGELILGIGVIMASAGLIVGCINASGLAFNLSLALVRLGQSNVLLLLLCAALASLVLGMGMPSVAAYSLVAVLVAPSLEAFGISKMASHMFVFYFSVISNITPPVAVSCFAAAPLAGANPTKVGFTSFRLAIAAYIVPFVFCFQPSIILEGPLSSILEETALCAYAIFAVCIALSGYWHAPVAMWRRVSLVAISAVILWPTGLLVNLAGVAALTAMLFPNIRMSFEKIKKRNFMN
jgi:TRAP transporter 4TM/12TM fusion protein